MGSSPCRARRGGDGCAGQVGWTRVPELGDVRAYVEQRRAPVAGTTTGGCTPRVGELPPGAWSSPTLQARAVDPPSHTRSPAPDAWVGGGRCRPRRDLVNGCPRVKYFPS